MYAFLKKVPLFADLPEADLERLCALVEEARLDPGQILFQEGSAGDRAYVIKEGQIEILKAAEGREVLLAVREPGEVIGELALMEDAPRMASARAKTASVLLAIPKATLDQLVNTSPSAARSLFYTVLARFRATGAMLRQSEKMAQLGTLTAGVAHELNNPAAAVKRGAAQLQEAVEKLARSQARLGALAEPQRQALEAMGQRARERAGRPVELDPLARSDREAELEGWLEERGAEEAWELAPALVAMGHDAASLAAEAAPLGPELVGPAAGWVAATHAVASLLKEIGEGATRISEIVKALKGYSYLDQAPVQEVDLHEGLDSTLVILRSKLKAGITVRREYAADLPRIQAYGSELNQVWTNLIDNAADALGGKGTIALRTRRERECVMVEIEDDGPGIPPEIQGRIFDAFFTTKPPGKGTGLGLDISYRIVVHKHRGDIKVFSQPGRTVFMVRLPVNFEKGAVAPMARAGEEQIGSILQSSRTLAVVGISDQEDSPAHDVPAYLQRHGYRILPVNPKLTEALGEKAYPSLSAIPDPVDLVLIFRRSEAVPLIVDEAIKIGAKTVWMQEGIVNEQAAETARRAGLAVVMDTCMRSSHRRFAAR